MPAFDSRAAIQERMDDPACDEAALLKTIDQFQSINRLVSRYRRVLARYILRDMQLDASRDYHLVDMGAGGCDIDEWLLKTARRRGLSLHVTAFETDPRIARHARETRGNLPGLEIRECDVLAAVNDEPVDYVFANHFLHHLGDDQIVELLRSWAPHVRRRMLFSDLLRHPGAYAAFWVFSLMYRNSFTREDGLASITRGFTPGELRSLAARAGLAPQTSVRGVVPGRLLLQVDFA